MYLSPIPDSKDCLTGGEDKADLKVTLKLGRLQTSGKMNLWELLAIFFNV